MADRGAQLDRLTELLELNPHCQAEINLHYLANIEADVKRTQTKAYRDAASANRRRFLADIIAETKQQVILLNLTMPNGKMMCDCTGEEMRSFGKAYQRIATKVGPHRKVGDVLRESEVRALMD